MVNKTIEESLESRKRGFRFTYEEPFIVKSKGPTVGTGAKRRPKGPDLESWEYRVTFALYSSNVSREMAMELSMELLTKSRPLEFKGKKLYLRGIELAEIFADRGDFLIAAKSTT